MIRTTRTRRRRAGCARSQCHRPRERSARTLSNDCEDAFLVETGPVRDRTGEQWARAIFDEAPIVMRSALPWGWCVLGLKLGEARSDVQPENSLARAVWAGVPAASTGRSVRPRADRLRGAAPVQTMNRDAAIGLLDRLHEAQNELYAGGSGAALRQLLAPSVTWTVPGENRIAGTYRGLEQVLDYFRRRRDLAHRTFQMLRRDILVGDGDRVAALVDGFATIRDVDHRWSTVGLYDVIDQRITACWLLPLDQHAFDAIWGG
jgi:ketosteroid isomerase-like protein